MAHIIGVVVILVAVFSLLYSSGSGISKTVEIFFSPAPANDSAPPFSYGGGQEAPVNSGEPQPPAISPEDVPKGFTLKDLSPYFHKVRFGSVSPGYGGYTGSISLYPNLGEKESVNVTGWSIRGNTGSYFIPQAVKLYDPSGLALEGDLYLRSGEVVNVYSAASAVGKNFRINKCMGYLGQTTNFEPPLYTNCPYVDQRDIAHLSGECQNYILSLGGCRLPDDNPPISIRDYRCLDYLDDFNYRGCFDKHKNDADFLSNEWRVWIGNAQFLDPLHDQVRLYDRRGLLVDEQLY